MPSFLGGIFLDLGRRRGEFTRVRLASVTAYYSHSRGRHNAVAAEAAPQARQSPGRPVVPVNATRTTMIVTTTTRKSRTRVNAVAPMSHSARRLTSLH